MRKFLILALLLSFLFPRALVSQRKPPKQRPPASASEQQPTAEIGAQAMGLAEQLKLLSRFLYIYGKISAGFETADEQLRRGEISETVLEQITRSKAAVAGNISAFRAGLKKLEPAFKTTPRLQPLYPRLTAISDTIAGAEQLASANRFDEAGKTLVAAAEKMTDLLASMK
ncbi:MAG TPA: hypothetical protein VGK99_06130 [Acidobacteriota bacterium]